MRVSHLHLQAPGLHQAWGLPRFVFLTECKVLLSIGHDAFYQAVKLWCSRNFGFHTWHFSDGLCVRGRGSISSSTKWEVRTKESWQKSASIFMKQYLTYISWKMVWGKRIQEEGENTQLGGVWKGPNAMSYQPALHSSILTPFLGSLF